MAINPPSDIVLGVALAADPEKYRLAAERLRQLGETRAASAASTPRPAEITAPRFAAAASSTPRSAATIRQAKGTPDVFDQLEAFVLQSFIQSMLPKNAEHVFGKGAAGEVWKSMLAEQLANEMARSGQVGLAKHLAAGRAGAPLTATASLSSVLPYLQPQSPDAPHRADALTTGTAAESERS